MSYQTFKNKYKSCEISKPKYIKAEKNFPANNIFVSIDKAAKRKLLAQNAKKCDVAFVLELQNRDTLSIFIEKKTVTVDVTDVKKQLESTIKQMISQNIFDKVGKEQILLILYSRGYPKHRKAEMQRGINFTINNKSQKIPVFHLSDGDSVWDKRALAKTF